MAKELPYYKHEPSEWLEGEIQICSDAAIVCFSNLCSGYWLKLGSMSYAFAVQKYCRRDESVIQELIECGVVDLNGDNIKIKFLDRQLFGFSDVSEKRSNAAKKRWNNANALQVQSKSNAIREDNIREDNSKSPKVDFDFDKFLTFINTTLGKKHTVINQAVRKSIKARLKEGYTKESFMNAVLNLKEVQTHRENNYTYCTPEFISRSATLDKYGQRHEVTPEDRLSQLKKERGWE